MAMLFVFDSCQKNEKEAGTNQSKEIKSVKSKSANSQRSTLNTKVDPVVNTSVQIAEQAPQSKTEKKAAKSVSKNSKKTAAAPANYKIYNNLKSLLGSLKVGQTMTKEQLVATKKVPDDALKIVRSVSKVSENELDVKWKSKWLLESVSDVELKDGRVKVDFGKGLVYTSGSAIGIDYNDKVYTKLVIKGDRAYIPTVKKYSWKIGS